MPEHKPNPFRGRSLSFEISTAAKPAVRPPRSHSVEETRSKSDSRSVENEGSKIYNAVRTANRSHTSHALFNRAPSTEIHWRTPLRVKLTPRSKRMRTARSGWKSRKRFVCLLPLGFAARNAGSRESFSTPLRCLAPGDIPLPPLLQLLWRLQKSRRYSQIGRFRPSGTRRSDRRHHS